MNKHDTERIAGLLEVCGYQPNNSIAGSDLVVYYTCCVRKSADERFYGQLSSTKYKKGAKVIVGGCLAQKEGPELLSKFKEVDLVFGTRNLKELPSLINNLNGQPFSNTNMLEGFNAELPSKRENKYKAWIAINQGCNNHCTYCIVPAVRGPEISRKLGDVVAEAKALVDDGVKEITLLGQNVNSYGQDIYGEPKFAGLLREVSATGVERLRFTTSHPKDLSEEVIIAIKEMDNICEHIHLPVQAGSSAVLKKMGRRYTKEHYLQLVVLIREHLPKASITTDIMVGFPGETEANFEDTLDLVEKAGFDAAFTFIYSTREGTAAAKMDKQIPYHSKLSRFKKLVELQDAISWSKNIEILDSTQEILVDGPTKKDKAKICGRTATNKLVHFNGEPNLKGQLVNVRIKEAKPFFLLGEIDRIKT